MHEGRGKTEAGGPDKQFLFALSPLLPPSDPVLARAILINSGLIFLFFVQHSLMARLPVRSFFDRMNIPAINRPFYVTCTCIAINVC